MIRVKKLIFSLLLPLAAGMLSFLLAGGKEVRGLYALFPKPAFALPGIAFPIVWTALYLMMGISEYLFSGSVSYEPAMGRMYWFQLLLNILWLPLFFRFRWLTAALILLLALALSVLTLFLMVRRANQISALLLLPYLLFLCYAAYLNYGIMALTA